VGQAASYLKSAGVDLPDFHARSKAMQRIAGTYGNSNRDDFLHAQKVDHTSDGLVIRWFDGSTTSIPLPDPKLKVTLASTPAAFPCNVCKHRGGGGVENSRVAAEFISEAVGGQGEIRYLDANRYDVSIASELTPPARTLALRDSPTNYVIGDGDDKKVFRSPVEPAGPLGAPQLTTSSGSSMPRPSS